MPGDNDDAPLSTTAAHLAGRAYTEAITDMNRVRLTDWSSDQIAFLPEGARHALALGPFAAMGLVAFADGRFDDAELQGIAEWINRSVLAGDLLGRLWAVDDAVLAQLRQQAREPDKWQSHLDSSVQALVSWVEPVARTVWVQSVRDATREIAAASSDGGLLAEFFETPINDDEHMVITSIDQVLEAALIAD